MNTCQDLKLVLHIYRRHHKSVWDRLLLGPRPNCWVGSWGSTLEEVGILKQSHGVARTAFKASKACGVGQELEEVCSKTPWCCLSPVTAPNDLCVWPAPYHWRARIYCMAFPSLLPPVYSGTSPAVLRDGPSHPKGCMEEGFAKHIIPSNKPTILRLG